MIAGFESQDHVEMLTAYGADCVRLAVCERLAYYDTQAYTAVLVKAIEMHKPYAVLLPSTLQGRDLAARVAGRLALGLTGDCIGLEIDAEGRLAQLKPAFGGSIVAPILSRTRPYMATVRPGILTPAAPDWSISPEVSSLPAEGLGQPQARVIEHRVDESAEGVELERAKVIVAVGKGVGSPENIAIARELADVLGAALGATRDVTDAGWLPRQHQIGLSGKSVAPALYVAVALRGPFNHTVGIQKAKTIVAINNNPRAPIFRSADFGIVGDYAEIVPALVSALKKRGIRH